MLITICLLVNSLASKFWDFIGARLLQLLPFYCKRISLPCCWSWQTSFQLCCCSQTGLPYFPVIAVDYFEVLLFSEPSDAPLLPSAFFYTDVNTMQVFMCLRIWGTILSSVFASHVFMGFNLGV